MAPHDEPFTIPLPPPGDVLYVRSDPGDREHEDIMLRKVATDVARRFRAAAGGRALTHAQYLAALVELHELARTRADAGDGELAAELNRLGLQTVTV